jgi:hypothetical protein
MMINVILQLSTKQVMESSAITLVHHLHLLLIIIITPTIKATSASPPNINKNSAGIVHTLISPTPSVSPNLEHDPQQYAEFQRTITQLDNFSPRPSQTSFFFTSTLGHHDPAHAELKSSTRAHLQRRLRIRRRGGGGMKEGFPVEISPLFFLFSLSDLGLLERPQPLKGVLTNKESELKSSSQHSPEIKPLLGKQMWKNANLETHHEANISIPKRFRKQTAKNVSLETIPLKLLLQSLPETLRLNQPPKTKGTQPPETFLLKPSPGTQLLNQLPKTKGNQLPKKLFPINPMPDTLQLKQLSKPKGTRPPEKLFLINPLPETLLLKRLLRSKWTQPQEKLSLKASSKAHRPKRLQKVASSTTTDPKTLFLVNPLPDTLLLKQLSRTKGSQPLVNLFLKTSLQPLRSKHLPRVASASTQFSGSKGTQQPEKLSQKSSSKSHRSKRLRRASSSTTTDPQTESDAASDDTDFAAYCTTAECVQMMQEYQLWLQANGYGTVGGRWG